MPGRETRRPCVISDVTQPDRPWIINQRLIGIITEADIVRDRFTRDLRYHHAYTDYVTGTVDHFIPTVPVTVGAVVTSPVTAISADSDVVDVVTAMLDTGVHSMPIVHDSRLVGILTRRDLVRALTRDDQAIAADVRRRLHRYGGPDRWSVEVYDGQVVLGAEFDDATDRNMATVLAQATPGVTGVHTIGSGETS